MVIFKDTRKIKKVSIPEIPDSEVEIYNVLLWGELEEVYTDKGTDLEKGRRLLSHIIKDWNLTDEAGQKLPITEEIFKRFTAKVINFLVAQTDAGILETDVNIEDKKKIEG